MPKALVPLAGKTLLQRSLDVLLDVEEIAEIVIALPEGVSAPAPEGASKAGRGGARVRGVRGGLTRSESVREALRASAAGDDSQVVLVHDAARPMVTSGLVERVIAAVGGPGVDAAVAAAPVSDTIKRADPVEGSGGVGGAKLDALPRVVETLRRSGLWAVQTPQAFRRGALRRALDQPPEVLRRATDDASLIEALGGSVVIVPSSPENLKVTTRFDLQLASLLLSTREPD